MHEAIQEDVIFLARHHMPLKVMLRDHGIHVVGRLVGGEESTNSVTHPLPHGDGGRMMLRFVDEARESTEAQKALTLEGDLARRNMLGHKVAHEGVGQQNFVGTCPKDTPFFPSLFSR